MHEGREQFRETSGTRNAGLDLYFKVSSLIERESMMIENILCMTLLSIMYLQLRSFQVEAVFVHDSNLTIYSHMSICIFSLLFSVHFVRC